MHERMTVNRRTVAIWLGAALGMMTMTGSDATAQSQAPRQVIFVACTDTDGQLCRALIRALAPHAPRAVFRRGTRPAQEGWIQITFHPDPDHPAPAGHLHWRDPAGGAGQGAAVVQIGKDATKSQTDAQAFADALVSNSPKLRSMLAQTN